MKSLQSGIIDSKHKYRSPQFLNPIKDKTLSLAKDAWVEKAGDRSLPFHEIASTNPVPGFYSPPAHSNNIPVADLQLVADARRMGSY
eukprot:15311210-Alexandrium_andersonii.AAC.1